MKRPTLSLEHYFVIRSYLFAVPIQGTEPVPEPTARFTCELLTPRDLVCTARVQWGEEGKTPYFVALDLRATFATDMDTAGIDEDRTAASRAYVGLCVNAAQIAYSAVRSHIATLTAVGPHPTWFLPTTTISQRDIELLLSDEMAESGVFPVAPAAQP